jgi:hypothetical protein
MTARYSIEKKKIPASIKTGQDFHPKFRLQPHFVSSLAFQPVLLTH